MMNNNTLKIVLADAKSEIRDNIKNMLSEKKEWFIFAEASNGDEAFAYSKTADLVIANIFLPSMDGFELSKRIFESNNPCVVILTSIQHDESLFRKAMRVGAKDLLFRPFTANNLIESISSCTSKKETVQIEKRGRSAKCFLFHSGKGGIGTTTITVNTALALESKKILIFDANFQRHHVSMHLNAIEKNSGLNFIQYENQAEVTWEDFLRLTLKYNENIDIATIASRLEFSHLVREEHIQHFITLAKENYDIILIDTGNFLDERTISMMESSDELFIVTDMSMPSIKETKITLLILKQFLFNENKIKVILNKFHTHGKISKQEIEDSFNKKIHTTLPLTAEMDNYIDIGKPIILDTNQIEFNKTIKTILNQPAKEGRGLLGGWKKLFGG